MDSEQDRLTLLRLSEMSINAYKLPSDSRCDDATNSTCGSSFKSSVSSSSQLSGWGSTISRKSYACLRTLEAETVRREATRHRFPAVPRCPSSIQQLQSQPSANASWGYFVDTPEH